MFSYARKLEVWRALSKQIIRVHDLNAWFHGKVHMTENVLSNFVCVVTEKRYVSFGTLVR